MYFKLNYDEDFQSVLVLKRICHNQAPKCGLANMNMSSVSSEKLKDLLELCSSGIIPEQYHNFYKNLNVKLDVNGNNDDLVIYNLDIDDDF